MNKDWIGNQTGQLVLLLCTVYHSGHFSPAQTKRPFSTGWFPTNIQMSKLVSYRSAEKSQTPVSRRRLACLLWLVSNPLAWHCRLHALGQQVEGAAGKDEAGLVLGDGMLGRDEDLLA